jgi:hypothetical protein
LSLPQPTPNVPNAPLPALADPAGCEECCLVPGSLQRVRSMQALREQGWSLDEIALRFGVSRERVRQIMRAHGGPAPADIAEARRRRAEADAEARIDELLTRLWGWGWGCGGCGCEFYCAPRGDGRRGKGPGRAAAAPRPTPRPASTSC